jgi:hypothetical protein
MRINKDQRRMRLDPIIYIYIYIYILEENTSVKVIMFTFLSWYLTKERFHSFIQPFILFIVTSYVIYYLKLPL